MALDQNRGQVRREYRRMKGSYAFGIIDRAGVHSFDDFRLRGVVDFLWSSARLHCDFVAAANVRSDDLVIHPDHELSKPI